MKVNLTTVPVGAAPVPAILVKKGRGQHAQHLQGALRVAVLALLAMPLQAGIAEQRVQARLFPLLVGRARAAGR